MEAKQSSSVGASLRKIFVKLTKRTLRLPANAIVLSSTELDAKLYRTLQASPAIADNPSVSATFYPLHTTEDSYILPKTKPMSGRRTADFPVPPRDLWWGYGDTPEKWVASGQEHVDNMLTILERSDFTPEGKRVLDLGCGAGRMLRCFADLSTTGDFRGVDVSARHIAWCHEHLCPPFRFATITTFPHVPFEDRHFDLVYAGSVFTHMSDLLDMWLLELKRILRPGGRLYITVHDEHTLRILDQPEWDDFEMAIALKKYDRRTGFRSSPFGMVSISGRGAHQAQVFFDGEYLRRILEREFSVLSVNPGAYHYQTGILLKRPE